MMKKTYQIPETYIFNELIVESPLAAASKPDEEGRIITGGVTSTSDGSIPQEVTPTSEENGLTNGQDGNSNRAKQWTGDWDLSNWELPNWE